MGLLPTIKRFVVDDFPDQASWIGTLLYPLNLLLNTIYSNLNNGITIAQNMVAQVATLPITGSSPTTSIQWKFSTISAPIGITVVNVVQTAGSGSVILGAVSCQWSYNAGTISISNITGLNSANSYNITFIVWGG